MRSCSAFFAASCAALIFSASALAAASCLAFSSASALAIAALSSNAKVSSLLSAPATFIFTVYSPGSDAENKNSPSSSVISPPDTSKEEHCNL